MEITNGIMFILSWAYSILIIGVYVLNAHFNILTLKKIRKINSKSKHQWIRWFEIIVSFGLAIVYSYIFYNYIMGDPINLASIFNMMVIRPIVFLLGSVTASNSRIRLVEFDVGKEG